MTSDTWASHSSLPAPSATVSTDQKRVFKPKVQHSCFCDWCCQTRHPDKEGKETINSCGRSCAFLLERCTTGIVVFSCPLWYCPVWCLRCCRAFTGNDSPNVCICCGTRFHNNCGCEVVSDICDQTQPTACFDQYVAAFFTPPSSMFETELVMVNQTMEWK